MDRTATGIRLRTAMLSALAACACASWMSAYFGAQFGVPGGAGTQAAMLACLLLFLCAAALRPKRGDMLACGLLGSLFSLMRVIGYSYDTQDSYGLIFKNGGALLRAALAFAALAAAASCALVLALALFRRAAAYACGGDEPQEGPQKGLFFLCAGIIFLGSVPYMALYAPGLNIFDTHDQILQFFGFPSYIGDGSALSDHHPVLLTLVYGGFMRVGLLLGDANIGQLLYSVISTAAIALCYALVLTELRRWGLRRGAVIAIAAAISLYPVLALYAFNMCKDVSIEPFVLLLVFLLLRMERTRGEAIKSRGFACGFFAVLLMLMLLRKPSLYALLFALPFWLWRYPGVRVRLAAITLCAAVLFGAGYTGLLLPACGVVPGETREMLSIPLQQTARYLVTYGEDMTQAEREAVSRVIDMAYTAEHYDPRLSDPVKDFSNPDLTGKDLAAYARAWLSMGLRHPGVYLDAWLNMIYGYFYPSDSNTIVCLTLNSPDRGGVTLRQDPQLDGARLNLFNLITYTLRRLPGFGALFYVDAVTWGFLFLLAVLMLRGGPGAAFAHMFFVGTLAICMLSPKSGEIRYLLPVLYALPALLGQALALSGKGERA